MKAKGKEDSLLSKGLSSLRTGGVRVTWQRVCRRLRTVWNYRLLAGQPLYSGEELAAQRAERCLESVLFSIVTPLYNTPEKLLRELLESVRAQTCASWELCLADGSDDAHGAVGQLCQAYAAEDGRIVYRKLEKNLGISGNTNAALELARGDYIALLDHDDLLHPAALHEVARAIREQGADFIYTDETTFRRRPRDAYRPHFKPVYAPDSLCGSNYICHLTVFKRALLEKTGLLDPACDGAQDHDLFLRLTEQAERIVHIPEILYYWRASGQSTASDVRHKPYVGADGIRAVQKRLERLGRAGEVEQVRPDRAIYRVRYRLSGTPKVSILLTGSGQPDSLESCLDAVFSKTTWPEYEIVIAVSGGASPELQACYERLRRAHETVRIVRCEGALNDAELINRGAEYCAGEYLLLLDSALRPITPGWIEEMLMFAQRGDVGAAGAKLYEPDGRVRHAGLLLGVGGAAGYAHRGCFREDTGYVGRLVFAQNVTAVTAECLLLRREVWDAVGGLEEAFDALLSGADLCLRLRRAGLLVVWTPYAELRHSRSKHRETRRRARAAEERRRFRQKWARELEAGDPYYNPNLSLRDGAFRPKLRVRPYGARWEP